MAGARWSVGPGVTAADGIHAPRRLESAAGEIRHDGPASGVPADTHNTSESEDSDVPIMTARQADLADSRM